jgi:exopolysaccharide production protein ExoZ
MLDRGRLNSVHFLRFFAAAAVVMHHAISNYQSTVMVGAAGVDVFFVISGIVICLALNSTEKPGSFALKRLIRVYPMLWIATIVYAFVRHHDYGEVETAERMARSMLMIPEFGREWWAIYYPAWTLGYELFFYGAATLALLFAGKSARVVCLMAMAFLAVVRLPVPFVPGRYFDTTLYLEFCFGVAISVAVDRGFILDRAMGGLLIILSFAAFALNYGIMGERQIEWGIPAAMLVFGMLSFDDAPILRNRYIVLGGSASYSIYLTHIPVVELIGVWLHDTAPSVLNHPVIASLLAFIPAILAGILVHLYVEKPVLAFARRLLMPRRGAADQMPAPHTTA